MRQAAANQLHHLVDRISSYATLADAERDAISILPAVVVYQRARADFVKFGERVDHCCLVAEGLVGRFDQAASGQRQISALHLPGEIPDLHLVVLPHATFTLRALVPTIVIAIPHSSIRTVAAAHPVAGEALRNCMVDAIMRAQSVGNTDRRHTGCRIAHLICVMAERYKGAHLSGKIVYNLPMPRFRMADATGMTFLRAHRSLRALKACGVEVRHRTVYIADWSRLVQAAGYTTSDRLQDRYITTQAAAMHQPV